MQKKPVRYCLTKKPDFPYSAQLCSGIYVLSAMSNILEIMNVFVHLTVAQNWKKKSKDCLYQTEPKLQ
jgi:hypothetical protein